MSNNRWDITHVGLIVAKERNIVEADWIIRVLSKWGMDGEYLHDERDVPSLLGTSRQYYSERK